MDKLLESVLNLLTAQICEQLGDDCHDRTEEKQAYRISVKQKKPHSSLDGNGGEWCIYLEANVNTKELYGV